MTVRILKGDCREVLRSLPDESVHCVVTSPPYYGLRNYQVDGQIGLEKTHLEYIEALSAVFSEVRRVVRADGVLWLNLGDSYASGKGTCFNPGGNTSSFNVHLKEQNVHPLDRGNKSTLAKVGLKPKDLIGIPWLVAFALRDAGWWLRQDIVWAKPNPMPESITDRCTKSHEYIFLLSKSSRYYYDADAIAEPVAESTIDRLGQPTLANQNGSDRVPGKTNGPMRAVFGGRNKHAGYGTRIHSGNEDTGSYLERGANKRSVWTVTTQPFTEAHFAVFPPALIEPCILAGCPEGGTVLDPFGGSGTTGLVADRLKRNAILIELNPDYADMAERRIRADAGMFSEVVSQ